MHTTVYLIRNAQTVWNSERRLAGRRELVLSEQGHQTAAGLVTRFAGVTLDELLVSPLPRTVETGQPLAVAQDLELARDPRLVDWNPGRWEGKTYDEIAADPHYKTLVDRVADKTLGDVAFPDGERFADILARMLGSIAQALSDNGLGARIGVVSHAGPLRLLLSHYLGVPALDHARLRLEPASVTILRFSGLDAPPTLQAINRLGPVLDSTETAR